MGVAVSSTVRKLYGQTGMREVDRAMTAVADAAKASLDSFAAKSIADGVLIANVTLDATPKSVSHGLKKPPRGWVVVDKNAGVHVFRTAWDKNTVTLAAGAAVTVSLWVF